jgi:hypothetical protein
MSYTGAVVYRAPGPRQRAILHVRGTDWVTPTPTSPTWFDTLVWYGFSEGVTPAMVAWVAEWKRTNPEDNVLLLGIGGPDMSLDTWVRLLRQTTEDAVATLTRLAVGCGVAVDGFEFDVQEPAMFKLHPETATALANLSAGVRTVFNGMAGHRVKLACVQSGPYGGYGRLLRAPDKFDYMVLHVNPEVDKEDAVRMFVGTLVVGGAIMFHDNIVYYRSQLLHKWFLEGARPAYSTSVSRLGLSESM